MNIIRRLNLLLAICALLLMTGCMQSLMHASGNTYNISDFTFPAEWASNGDAYVLTIYTTQKKLTIGTDRKARIKKSLKSVIRQYGSVLNNDTLQGNQFALHAIDPGQVSIQGIQSLGKDSRIITRLNNTEVCPPGRILMLWFYADTMAKSSGYLTCKKKILSYSDATQLTTALRSGTMVDLPINPLSFFENEFTPEYVAHVPKNELRTQITPLPGLTAITEHSPKQEYHKSINLAPSKPEIKQETLCDISKEEELSDLSEQESDTETKLAPSKLEAKEKTLSDIREKPQVIISEPYFLRQNSYMSYCPPDCIGNKSQWLPPLELPPTQPEVAHITYDTCVQEEHQKPEQLETPEAQETDLENIISKIDEIKALIAEEKGK